MKKLINLPFLSLLLLCISPSYSLASVALGKKTYKHTFYKKCGFSGVQFARKHTQGEWEEIYESGDLPQESHVICPKLDIVTVESKRWKDIYQYVTKYAKDGVAPNGCND